MFLSSCLQIKHMMAFIEQEANEKAEEIDAKVQSHTDRMDFFFVFGHLMPFFSESTIER